MPVLETPASMLLLWGTVGYGLGSIPFGIVIVRLLGLGDLRAIGSGNIGTTNVLRTGSKVAAALTLLMDGSKGAVAALMALGLAGRDAAQLAALAALLGHCFPLWLRFRGGKGVATWLGVMLALAWPAGIACCLVWLLAAYAWRFSSLSALCAAGSAVLWVMVFGYGDLLLLTALLCALIFLRHRDNIHRLRTGLEPKIGKR
ncbi:MAG: glycerol-3-phosphate 1-O-acyltransferase PlsY [Rhodobacteraceae bacterium]|nr:glycerol-3-phosphate 1-O-acyltransferase PlsY [Paracoccaceae bacterium]